MDRDALAQAILDLEYGRDQVVADPEVACELANHLRPQIARLLELRQENGRPPAVAGADVDVDDARPENGSPSAKRRRRRDKRARKGAPDGPLPELLSLSPQEQARWIFMERYVPLERNEEIFSCALDADRFAEYQQELDSLIKNLLLTPRMAQAADKNNIQGLQRMLASQVLLFRGQCIGDETGKPIPCTFENLRQQFPSYFYKRRQKPNWFERYGFYSEPLAKPGWALCDTEYLNCTLRRPARKLASYADEWEVPKVCVRQKTVLEDIHDRILCGEALEEDVFATNCNSLARTTYRTKKSLRIVFTVQKVHKITIHGKAGMPHWRATRRLWPGTYPSIAFTGL